MSQYKYLAATAQIKISAGNLKSIFVSSGTDVTIAVYDTDNEITSGTTLLSVFSPSAPGNYTFTSDGTAFNKGLYVVLGGTTPKVTVTFD